MNVLKKVRKKRLKSNDQIWGQNPHILHSKNCHLLKCLAMRGKWFFFKNFEGFGFIYPIHSSDKEASRIWANFYILMWSSTYPIIVFLHICMPKRVSATIDHPALKIFDVQYQKIFLFLSPIVPRVKLI